MRERQSDRRRRQGDDGIALPMVLGTMMVLTAFVLTSLALVLNTMAPSRSDQDSRAALAAAQAGVDEYTSRLSANSEYWATPDPSNLAFSDSIPVPGTGSAGASFRYEVITTSAITAQQGYLTLKVTGTSKPPGAGRAVTRVLTARLEPAGFLDYIYLTDYETIDPSLRDLSPAQRQQCTRHSYEGRSDAACDIINWTSGDVVDGPLHSNDSLYVGGAVHFTSPRTESSWVKTTAPEKLWRGPGTPLTTGGARPGYLPVYAPVIDLPDANTELLRYVLPKTDTTSNPNTREARPGCLYRGATQITFTGTKMKVWSPNTTNAPDHCLTVGNAANEQTKDIPKVIHIAPTTGPCRPIGYPRTGEDLRGDTTDYDDCHGSAFVQGQADAQVTVSAEDDIIVTGDLTIADRGGSTDVIGLVAGNYVWVYHPVTTSGANLLPYGEAVRNIEAAIISLRHSFVVQNWNEGAPLSNASAPASSLRVYGAIAQLFRGAVGTGTGTAPSTGYLKNYVYDPRLQILQPPYFLSPDDAPWEAVRITDG